MIKNYILLTIAFFSAHLAMSQSAATQKEEVITDGTTNALLWEVSGDDINTSYVFGTIHLIPEDDYFIPEGTEDAIDASEKMVFEIDLQEMMEDPMAQMSMLMKAFMNDGSSLSSLLSEEDYQLVKDHFDEMGLPIFMFEKVKPMFLVIFASGDMDMSMDGMSMDGSKSYEMEFLDMATEREMSVGGLETVEFQISIFDSIPYDVQAQMLVESIKGADAGSTDLEDLIEKYKSQDINALYEALAESDEQMMEYEDVLVSGRNKNWIPVMEEMMTAQSTFFAVGAGHLAGEEGVLQLLIQEGYSVKPISDAGNPAGSRKKQRF